MALATFAAVMSCSATVIAFLAIKSLITRTYPALDFLGNVTGPKMPDVILLNTWTENFYLSALHLVFAVDLAK